MQLVSFVTVRQEETNSGLTMAPVLLKLEQIHGHEVLWARPVMQSAQLKGKESYFGSVALR